MPNPPKPNELKRKIGNPGKRPLPELKNVVALPMATQPPTPPRPLGPEGLKLWNRIWDEGKSWISPASDLEVVILLCESMDERTQLRLQVLKGSDWRDRVALRSLESQIVSMLSAIGFDPVSRTKLGVAEVQKQSALDQLIARRQKQPN
ncbi:MAG: phage terminase small subunit P27 family [Candidatus Nanopelagicaceae bacterium]